MSDITNQPLYPGDTWEWTENISEYPADEFNIKYLLQKKDETPFEIVSTNDSGEHKFSKLANLTQNLESGTYKFQKKAVNILSSAQKTISSGNIEVLISLTSGTDSRTFNQIILDALRATLQGRATREQHSMQISGRAIQYLTPLELRTEIEIYEAKVETEKRLNNGESGIPAVRLEFGAIS